MWLLSAVVKGEESSCISGRERTEETSRGPAPRFEHAPKKTALTVPSRKNFMEDKEYLTEDENSVRERGNPQENFLIGLSSS